MIRCKTAVLFQGACRTGALVAGADDGRVERLSGFGYHLGIAFQMADDLLDYTQDLTALGKRAGADLREGKMTLPLIHALSKASAADRRVMLATLGNPNFSDGAFADLVEMLNAYGGIDYTRAQAAAHIQTAKTQLGAFDDRSTRDLLTDIADYALVRSA